MHATTDTIGRFVDPEDLVCPGCAQQVRDGPARGPGPIRTEPPRRAAAAPAGVAEPVEVFR